MGCSFVLSRSIQGTSMLPMSSQCHSFDACDAHDLETSKSHAEMELLSGDNYDSIFCTVDP